MKRITLITTAVVFTLAASCETEEINPCENLDSSTPLVCVDGEEVCPVAPGVPVYDFNGACRYIYAEEFFTNELKSTCSGVIILPERLFSEAPSAEDPNRRDCETRRHVAFGEESGPVVAYQTADGRDSLWRAYYPLQSDCQTEGSTDSLGYAFGATRLGNDQVEVSIYAYDLRKTPRLPCVGDQGSLGIVERITLERGQNP